MRKPTIAQVLLVGAGAITVVAVLWFLYERASLNNLNLFDLTEDIY